MEESEYGVWITDQCDSKTPYVGLNGVAFTSSGWIYPLRLRKGGTEGGRDRGREGQREGGGSEGGEEGSKGFGGYIAEDGF